MKTYLYIAILGCIVPAAARAAERPNIVFMLSDDQAWNGLSVPMHPNLDWAKSSIVETPNLERLAAQGMRFSAAYAPASVCSPTRISLQTGKSSAAICCPSNPDLKGIRQRPRSQNVPSFGHWLS